MSTCGYVCPACEGKGYLDDGTICDWCNVAKPDEARLKIKWILIVFLLLTFCPYI